MLSVLLDDRQCRSSKTATDIDVGRQCRLVCRGLKYRKCRVRHRLVANGDRQADPYTRSSNTKRSDN